MAVDREHILNIMKSRTITIDEFNYDNLICPPIYSMFTQEDIDRLYQLASSIRYSAKTEFKHKEIDRIMRSRGFVKFGAGTNRLVYRPLESDLFLVKVAYDRVAIQDNIKEYINQQYLKPFCTKTFEFAGNGVIATVERVKPITSREEFYSIAEDVFTLINDYIIGEYVMDDIGSFYFCNYGLRTGGFGPVILDYSTLYKLDGKKLYCCKPDNNSPTGTCDGVIDYDDGFNHLFCTKCGAFYKASELAEDIDENKVALIKAKGEKQMKVSLKGGSNSKITSVASQEFIDAKVIPSTGKIRLKKQPADEKPVEPKPEVRVNGVPEELVKDEVKVEAEVLVSDEVNKNNTVVPEEEVVKVIKVEDKVEIRDTVQVKPVFPKDTEPVAAPEKKEVVSPISFRYEKKESLYDTLKEAIYNVDKYLSLILNNKSCNDQPQARKEIIDLINLVLGKVIEGASTEDLAKIVQTVFTVARIDCETSYEDGIHNICMNIVDNRNDDMLYYGANNISMKVVEDEEENEISYTDEGSSENVEEEEDVVLTGIEAFSAITMDLSMIFPNESGKAILIEDGDEYLTVGDNKLLAITKIDDMSVDKVTVISTKLLDNKDEIIQTLSAQLAASAEEITADDVTVNGVPVVEE